MILACITTHADPTRLMLSCIRPCFFFPECNDADREGCCRLGSPVCASNGISYFNMRVPEVKKCKTAFANPSLTLVDRGESCCFPGIPVCASNGITYGNENFFKTLDCVYAFMQGTLSISHRGRRCGGIHLYI